MNIKTALPVFALLGIIGFITFAPSASFADGGPFSLGLRAVSFSPEDGDNAWGGGVQARLQLPLMFAAEASIDYREYKVGDRMVTDYPIQLSGLMYFLPKIVLVQPYILGGGGWYNTTVETPGSPDDSDSRFAPHAGVGVDFSLGPDWFIDATYRYIWLDGMDDIDDAGHQITAGINYRI